jgi:hypothetical protein
MKRLLILPLLLIPIWITSQTITISAANQRKIENVNYGDNLKLVHNLSMASLTDTGKLVISPLRILNKVEIQVDWTSLTGTLDAVIKIEQRDYSDMQWVCLQPVETDPGNLVKTLSTAAGSYVFTLWAFCGSDMRLLIIKNSCTGGIINASLGLRR